MKHLISTLMIALLLAVSCNKNPSTPEESPTWNQCATLPENGLYSDIFFIDTEKGWLVGQSDRIFHSNNRGESWELQNSTDNSGTFYSLSSVHFIDAEYGWATGYGSAFYTIDGGATWNFEDLVCYDCHDWRLSDKLIFLDRKNVLSFFHSVNSSPKGVRVSIYTFDADSAKFSWVAFHQFTSGLSAITHLQYNIWVADVRQNIHLSTDGGITWSTAEVEADSGEVSAINDIRFTDEQNGWFCSNTSVYHSEDGGNNWRCKATLQDSSLSRICFFNNKGWVMGEQAIYYSSDGGDTWEEQYQVAEGDTLVSLSFVNDSNGWALSQGGKVYRYGIE